MTLQQITFPDPRIGGAHAVGLLKFNVVSADVAVGNTVDIVVDDAAMWDTEVKGAVVLAPDPHIGNFLAVGSLKYNMDGTGITLGNAMDETLDGAAICDTVVDGAVALALNP
jgi:hypothetical protein